MAVFAHDRVKRRFFSANGAACPDVELNLILVSFLIN